jgi:hypothetical protein
MPAGMRANFQFNRYIVSEARTCRREGAFTTVLCKLYRRVKFYSEHRALHSAIAAIYNLLGLFKGNELNLCTISCFFIGTTGEITDAWLTLAPICTTVRDITLRSVVGSVINGEHHFWDLRSYKFGDRILDVHFLRRFETELDASQATNFFTFHQSVYDVHTNNRIQDRK